MMARTAMPNQKKAGFSRLSGLVAMEEALDSVRISVGVKQDLRFEAVKGCWQHLPIVDLRTALTLVPVKHDKSVAAS